MKKVKIVEWLMTEVFTLVFGSLARSSAEGLSLNQALDKLEQEVCEQYGIDHETILGLVAKDALQRLGE